MSRLLFQSSQLVASYLHHESALCGVDPKTVQYLAGHENIEYYTIANQKQARYNIDKKTKATATVQKIDFGCFHKEQIENRYPQWLKTLVCSAWRKLFE